MSGTLARGARTGIAIPFHSFLFVCSFLCATTRLGWTYQAHQDRRLGRNTQGCLVQKQPQGHVGRPQRGFDFVEGGGLAILEGRSTPCQRHQGFRLGAVRGLVVSEGLLHKGSRGSRWCSVPFRSFGGNGGWDGAGD